MLTIVSDRFIYIYIYNFGAPYITGRIVSTFFSHEGLDIYSELLHSIFGIGWSEASSSTTSGVH